MKKRFNSGFRIFFMITMLIGIGGDLYAEYSFHNDKIVLSSELSSEESIFVSDMDFFEEDQISHHMENYILAKRNLENYNFKNSFLILKTSFIIWQPPKNYA